MGYRIGVDIGGTFTDFCLFDEDAKTLRSLKVLSTPADPGSEVLNGLRRFKDSGIDASQVAYFTLSQTVGVNAVIQRKGAKLALFTTKNFRDVLELERLRLPEVFNIMSRRPAPLITRDCVFPIDERMRADGTEKTPLDEGQVRDAVRNAKKMGCEGIVISFLNAYRNPAHEQRAAEIARGDGGGMFVFTSSEVWPVIREFERTITTVMNGYVHPKLKRYLTSMQKALADEGVASSPMIAKSNGGVMSTDRAITACAHVMLSGPALGVMGASHVANLAGEKKVLSLDMGGTSTDVAVITDGTPQYGMGERVGDFHLFTPSVSVSSIGAGGGSLAWVDPYGVLKVGPDSAGSDPGPACYGKGSDATLTDAFAVCGFLGKSELGFGAVSVSLERARSAVASVATRIGRDVRDAAESIIDVAVSGMYLEFGKLLAKYGIDPREFSLLPFGGAGPMIGCFLARELGMSKIIVPTAPGVLSALGGLVSNVKNDLIKSVVVRLDKGALPILRDGFRELTGQAREWLKTEGHFKGQAQLMYSADMRYLGQKFEIEVPLSETAVQNADLSAMGAEFHRRHEAVYDYCDRSAMIELVNLRLVVLGINPKPAFNKVSKQEGAPRPIRVQTVYFDGQEKEAAVYSRADLGAGCELVGPAIIVQEDTTTCILDDFRARVDDYGILVLERTK